MPEFHEEQIQEDRTDEMYRVIQQQSLEVEHLKEQNKELREKINDSLEFFRQAEASGELDLYDKAKQALKKDCV